MSGPVVMVTVCWLRSNSWSIWKNKILILSHCQLHHYHHHCHQHQYHHRHCHLCHRHHHHHQLFPYLKAALVTVKDRMRALRVGRLCLTPPALLSSWWGRSQMRMITMMTITIITMIMMRNDEMCLRCESVLAGSWPIDFADNGWQA